MTASEGDKKPQYAVGRFQRELKNRFLCEVMVDGVPSVCYVPSSCHLGNFLQLQGKEVLLTVNRGKHTRTKYALYACPYKRSYILLSPAIANKAIANSISGRRFSFLGSRKCIHTEYIVEGYKADLFVQDTATLVEIKAVISLQDEAVFPTVYSERTLKQLVFLESWLAQGKKANFLIVSLNPYTKKVRINENSEFATALTRCIKLGLHIRAFSCRLNNKKEVVITQSLPIVWTQVDSMNN